MTATSSLAAAIPYYIFVIVVLLALLRLVRRTFANYKGTRFSMARTVVFSAVYVAIGFFFSALSYVNGVTPLLAVPQLVLGAVAAFWAFRYTGEKVTFWKAPDGSIHFRGGVATYIIYIFGLVTRLSIDVLFIGPSMFSFASGSKLSGIALYGSLTTDLILLFGVGLLIGRSVRVARRYQAIKRGRAVVPVSPSVAGLHSAQYE